MKTYKSSGIATTKKKKDKKGKRNIQQGTADLFDQKVGGCYIIFYSKDY